MNIKKESDWFRHNIMNKLSGFDVIEKSFPSGDFGALEQIEFNSDKISGNIDFWSLGWIGILVWDREHEQELMNILCEPSEKEKIEEAFNKLRLILQ